MRLTVDHTPKVPAEHERITSLGGLVSPLGPTRHLPSRRAAEPPSRPAAQPPSRPAAQPHARISLVQVSRGRVHGILAVSRAFGDLEMQPYVSAEPQVTVVSLTHEDTTVILASDGVWGGLSDDEAADIAHAQPDAQRAADALLAEVVKRGGRDNASMIVAMWKSR